MDLELTLKGNPGALMRLAMLHIANAIAKDGVASNLHRVRQGAHLDDRDEQLLEAIRLCKQSMTRPKKRAYRRRVPVSVRTPPRRPPPS